MSYKCYSLLTWQQVWRDIWKVDSWVIVKKFIFNITSHDSPTSQIEWKAKGKFSIRFDGMESEIIPIYHRQASQFCSAFENLNNDE